MLKPGRMSPSSPVIRGVPVNSGLYLEGSSLSASGTQHDQ